MVARARAINWNLLLNPVSQGLQMEAEGNRTLANSIFGAGQAIGSGIARSRAEAESKRRFNVSSQREQDAMDLRAKIHADAMLERDRERQANDTSLLDAAQHLSTLAIGEAGAHGQVNPDTSNLLTQVAEALGGPAAAEQRLAARAMPSPNIQNGQQGPSATATASDAERMRRGGAAEAPAVPYLPPAPEHLPPDAAAPMPQAPTGTVGESGVVDRPSVELFGEADRLKAQMDAVTAEARDLRSRLDRNSIYGNDARAKARVALANAESVLITLGAKHGAATRRAAQAQQRETALEAEAKLKADLASRAAQGLQTDNEALSQYEKAGATVHWPETTLPWSPITPNGGTMQTPFTEPGAAEAERKVVEGDIAQARKAKPENTPEAAGEAEARKAIAKERMLRAAGIETPSSKQDVRAQAKDELSKDPRYVIEAKTLDRNLSFARERYVPGAEDAADTEKGVKEAQLLRDALDVVWEDGAMRAAYLARDPVGRKEALRKIADTLR